MRVAERLGAFDAKGLLRQAALEREGTLAGLLKEPILLLSDGLAETREPTPTAYERATETHTSDAMVFNLAGRIGKIAGYTGERDGALIQSVFPVVEDANLPINSGSEVEFSLHTENAHHPYPPTVLGLYCLRDDAGCSTRVSDCDAAYQALDTGTQNILDSHSFITRPGASFRRGQSVVDPHQHAIRSSRFGLTSYVFNAHNTEGINAASQRALDMFVQEVKCNSSAIRLVAGQLLLLDNLVVAHGRSAFTPLFDGADRWLRRFYVVPPSAPGTPHPVRASALLM